MPRSAAVLPTTRHFFATLAGERTVRPPIARQSSGSRSLASSRPVCSISIASSWGGLDEGVWPPRAQTDGFPQPPDAGPMGLAAPERRIGQTAHDLVQGSGRTTP
jgi:ATP-dependent helicase/nuclease subunit B